MAATDRVRNRHHGPERVPGRLARRGARAAPKGRPRNPLPPPSVPRERSLSKPPSCQAWSPSRPRPVATGYPPGAPDDIGEMPSGACATVCGRARADRICRARDSSPSQASSEKTQTFLTVNLESCPNMLGARLVSTMHSCPPHPHHGRPVYINHMGLDGDGQS